MGLVGYCVKATKKKKREFMDIVWGETKLSIETLGDEKKRKRL